MPAGWAVGREEMAGVSRGWGWVRDIVDGRDAAVSRGAVLEAREECEALCRMLFFGFGS